MELHKCTMTGCGKPPTQLVVLSVPGDIAAPGGALKAGALRDAFRLPACDDHAEHVAKLFYGAAHALSGTVTTASTPG